MTYADALTTMVNGAKPADLPQLAAELGRALAVAIARATSAELPMPRAAPEASGPLLTVAQAAERLGVKRSWLYRHAKTLSFTRKLGHRTLRFDARALERWASTRPSA